MLFQTASRALLLAALAFVFLGVSPAHAQTTISGTVSLPGMQTATANIPVSIELETLDAQGNFLGFDVVSVQIANGQDSVPFSTTISDSAVNIRIGFSCNGAVANECDDFAGQGFYYTPTGNVYVYGQAQFAISSLPASIPIVLEPAIQISGTIGFDDGTMAANDLDIFVTVAGLDGQDQDISGSQEQVQISMGTESTTFTAKVAAIASNLRIAFNCSDGFGNDCTDTLTSPAYFTPTGNTFDFTNSSFPIGDLPSPLSISLEKSIPLNGQVGLPGGAAATANMLITVIVESYGANDVILGSEFKQVSLASGASSASFTSSYPDTAQTVRINFSCDEFGGDCTGFSTSSAYYTPSGNVFDVASAAIPIGNIPALVPIELVAAESIDFNVSLPSGFVPASGFVGVGLFVEAFDNLGGPLGSAIRFLNIFSPATSTTDSRFLPCQRYATQNKFLLRPWRR